MLSMTRKIKRARTVWLVILLPSVAYLTGAQTQTTPSTCPVFTSPPCAEGMAPGVLQITADPNKTEARAKLARKTFYLSTCPFDLAHSVNFRSAPSIRSYYQDLGVSTQLIDWLEQNHCESIYCRELTEQEVTCEGLETKKCVTEFNDAYHAALIKLNGNRELARKWVTNYAPLSDPKLRVGFKERNRNWIKTAFQDIQKRLGTDFRFRSAITDKDGTAVFYNVCPGSYYISSVAPIDIDGTDIVWETLRPINVEGPPDVRTITRVTLALPPGKDKKNYFVGRTVAELIDKRSPVQ